MDDASPGRGRGRRRDGNDSRAEIIAAASREFVERGYDAASFRGIARRAGVDAALIHHYFADKAELFTESVQAPIRPDRIVAQILQGPRDRVGDSLVRLLLSAMEQPRARDRVIGLLRTALGHDFAATMLRQYLFREVFHRIADGLGVPDGELRANLAASQVVGLMVVRYGVKAEPLASESIDEVAQRVGPVIQWHLMGYPGAVDTVAGPAE